MLPEWVYLLSAAAAIITAVSALFVSVSTRQKNRGDAAHAISQAAQDIVEIREKDIAELRKESSEKEEELKNLKRVVEDRGTKIAELNSKVEAREQDIEALRSKIDDLYKYIEYLRVWIATHVVKGKQKPATLPEFIATLHSSQKAA